MSESNEESRAKRPVYRATRMVLLAAMGAAALARDEMKSRMERYVDRGELAEGDARKLMREMMDRHEKMVEKHTAAPQKEAASTADVEALQAKIADLTRQIEALKQEKAS